MSIQLNIVDIIDKIIEPTQIIPLVNTYPINLYKFFNYLLIKFLNPQKIKITSIEIIKNIYINMNNDKNINFINIATCMFNFAVKIKGDQVRKLVGFKDCGFIGINNQQIKLDFIIKYAEFMAAFYYDYNYLLVKYFYVMQNFYHIDKYQKELFKTQLKNQSDNHEQYQTDNQEPSQMDNKN